MTWDIESAAEELLRAEKEADHRRPLSDDWPGMDLEQAYAVQDATLRARLERGESITGVKLGLTSEAKQRRMGVAEPVVAWLTDAMALPSGSAVLREGLIHPRAEPEIVFVMGSRLSGPGATARTALDAVERVHGGVEVIDSRFTDFRFTLPDVIADNASAACYAVGKSALRPDAVDLAAEEAVVELDGRMVDSGTGAAVLGHPAEALALAANALARRGLAIEPGWIILTGAITDAVPLPARSRVEARFARLGSTVLYGG